VLDGALNGRNTFAEPPGKDPTPTFSLLLLSSNFSAVAAIIVHHAKNASHHFQQAKWPWTWKFRWSTTNTTTADDKEQLD
jgi:hypothetical protein